MREHTAAPAAAAMAVVTGKLAVAELAYCLPPLWHALGRVDLTLANGMMETRLSPSSSWNAESSTVLYAPP